MKIFRFLPVGARVLLRGSAEMSRQRTMHLLEHEMNLRRPYATNPDYAQGLCALGVVDAALGNKEGGDSRGRARGRS